ncbi:MAG: hypothetical protein M5T52_03760 [Ignavibacteriaceae bacterium]|nr:hypothetical protein [Ignavibacteriaceae bacterium]
MGSFDNYGQDMKSKDIHFKLHKDSKETTTTQTDESMLADPLPIIANFENGLFPPTGWTRNGTAIWTNDNTVSGYGMGTWSGVADFYSTPTVLIIF